MAHVEKKVIRWNDPSNPKVVKHGVYVAKEGDTLDMSSIMAEIAMPKLKAVCPDDFPEGTFDDNTVSYQIGIVAFTATGNYSDMEVLPLYPFDFVPPDMPTGGRVE